MLSRRVPPQVFVVATVAALLAAACGEWRAVGAADPSPRTIGAAYCLRCHTDAASVRKLRLKEGGAHFLFRTGGGGSAACPASASRARDAGRGKTVSR